MDYNATETVHLPFNTFTSDDPSASVTITDLVAADIHIHKDGSVTQRSSAAGVTISVDFDGITGNHMAHIDLSDNTDEGFYAVGSTFQVRIEGTTVDAGTINAWIGTFSVGRTLRTVTAGRTIVVDANGLVDANVVKVGPTASGTAQTALDINDILTDTNELQTDDIPGRLDTLSASVSAIPTVMVGTDGANTTVPDAAGVVPGRLDTISGSLTVITADTNELQTDDIPGRLDTISGSVTVINTAILNIQGTGFASATSSLAAIRTQGDIAWITGGGGAAPTVIEIREEMDSNSTKLSAIITDTSATIPGRLDTLSSSVTVINTSMNNIKGTGFASATSSLAAIRTRGDIAWITGAGGSSPTVEQIRTEMDDNSSKLAAIIIDTSATIPGRLDTLSASVSAIPTTAMRGTDGVSLVIPDVAGVVPGRLNTMSASISAIPTTAMRGTDGVSLVIPDAAGVVPARLDTISATLTVIEADTNELQSDDIPTRLNTLSSSVTVIDINVDAIQIDTSSTIPGLINALNDVSTAQVNAEVLDVMNIDTYAEPGTGAPGSTVSIFNKINWMYKSFRNKKRQTATVTELYNDDGTTIGSKRTTAGSSSTSTIGEWGTG